jgi:hypothetical protein
MTSKVLTKDAFLALSAQGELKEFTVQVLKKLPGDMYFYDQDPAF